MVVQDGFVRPTWDRFYQTQLMWPIISQAILTVLMIFLSLAYHRMTRWAPFRWFISRYIGKAKNPKVERPAFIVLCCFLQVICSTVSVAYFITDTYDISEGRWHWFKKYKDTVGLQDFLYTFFIFQYFLHQLQKGFSVKSCWSLGALVDVFTVVPVLQIRTVQHDIDATWLSLRYLRVFRALEAFESIKKTIELDASPWTFWALTFFLRTSAIVIGMGGTIFVLEVLGELPGWQDKTIETGMGSVSMFQMLYWIITTISTVGYGDFSPSTIPSRAFICVFIFAGVFFFGQEIASLSEIKEHLGTGRGRYVSGQRPHVILTGSGVSKMSSMLEILLFEVLDPENGVHAPNVVVLSEEPYDPELKTFVDTALPGHSRRRLHLLRGSAMSIHDLHRVQLSSCRMVMIIPNMTVVDPLEEDSANILRAMELRRACPTVRLRLMLLEPESEDLGKSLGIPTQRMFNANGLTANLLSDSARVRGLIPLLGGLMQVTAASEMSLKSESGKSEWWVEYAKSTAKQIYGMVIGAELVGMQFGEAAARIYKESNGQVLLVAAQVQGHIAMNYKGQLKTDMIVMVIASTYRSTQQFADLKLDWKKIFIDARLSALNLKAAEERSASSRAAGVLGDREGKSLKKSNLRSTFMVENLYDIGASSETSGKLPTLDSTESLQEHESLVVLILMGSSTLAWQHAAEFVSGLRDGYLPAWQSIIVHSWSKPPASFVAKYAGKRVAVEANMEKCGIERAQTIVVMRSATNKVHDSGSSIVMADHKMVALHGLIETMPPSNPARVCIYEFGSTNAVHLLKEHNKTYSASRREMIASSHLDLSLEDSGPLSPAEALALVEAKAKSSSRSYRRAAALKQKIIDLFSKGLNAGSNYSEVMSEALLMQPLFASGGVISPDFFGGMLGHIFIFPGTIEFMECITMPMQNNQDSYLWQVRCPAAWVGRTYGDLVQSWMLQEDGMWEGCGSCLVIALYRTQQDAEGETQRYNYTLPDASCELMEEDWLTVLGSKEFAARAVETKDEKGQSLLFGIHKGSEIPEKYRASGPG